MHGVALSIGTVDPLNSEYLQKLKKLIGLAQARLDIGSSVLDGHRA